MERTKNRKLSPAKLAAAAAVLAVAAILTPPFIHWVRKEYGKEACYQNLLALERQYLTSDIMEQSVSAGSFNGQSDEGQAICGGCPSGGRYVPCIVNGRKRLKCTVHGLASGGFFSGPE